MNSKSLQTSSSLFLGISGITLLFFPQELVQIVYEGNSNALFEIIIQLISALFFGFAMLNWMSKTILMGGIYGKAIYVSNFAHYSIGTLSLLRWGIKEDYFNYPFILVLIIYTGFSLCYGLNFINNPTKLTSK